MSVQGSAKMLKNTKQAEKISAQNFSSRGRKTQMLFCQEYLPMMKPGFIIMTH